MAAGPFFMIAPKDGETMREPLHKLIGRPVEVRTGDLLYRGVLREVTTDRVALMATTGWREVPMERVVDIRPRSEE